MEHSRYPVDFSQGFNALMPHLSDIRKGAQMLLLEVVLHAENAEPQLAVDSVTAIVGIARSLEKEPMLISQLVRIACQALGASTIERLINRAELGDKQLMQIERSLINTEKSDGMIRAFAGERCIVGSLLQDFSSQDISMYGGPSVATPLMSFYKIAGLADADALLYIDFMTKYMEAMQLAPHYRKEASKAIEADFDKISKIHILLHIIRPAFSRCVEVDLKCLANIQAARVGIAVERYRLATGNLPETLSDLLPSYIDTIAKDPFDGEQLRYKKRDFGFVVYSVGEDGHDDGGKERLPKEKRRSEPDTYDITFIIQR